MPKVPREDQVVEVLRVLKVILVPKEQPDQLDQLDRKGQQVLKDQQVHKELKGELALREEQDQQDQQDHKVRGVHKVLKVLKVRLDLLVVQLVIIKRRSWPMGLVVMTFVIVTPQLEYSLKIWLTILEIVNIET